MEHGNDRLYFLRKQNSQSKLYLKSFLWLYGVSEPSLRHLHRNCCCIYYCLSYVDVSDFFLQIQLKLVLGKDTYFFTPDRTAIRLQSEANKPYVRARLPRQIFLLFCCKLCCSVHSSKDIRFHSFL